MTPKKKKEESPVEIPPQRIPELIPDSHPEDPLEPEEPEIFPEQEPDDPFPQEIPETKSKPDEKNLV